MIDIREDITKPKVWTTEPSQLTLEQALEILNPDSGYQYIALRRGAYKRLLIELKKGKNE